MPLKQIERIHAGVFAHLQCFYCRQYSSARELLFFIHSSYPDENLSCSRRPSSHVSGISFSQRNA